MFFDRQKLFFKIIIELLDKNFTIDFIDNLPKIWNVLRIKDKWFTTIEFGLILWMIVKKSNQFFAILGCIFPFKEGTNIAKGKVKGIRIVDLGYELFAFREVRFREMVDELLFLWWLRGMQFEDDFAFLLDLFVLGMDKNHSH